jgi:hypothetical protein
MTAVSRAGLEAFLHPTISRFHTSPADRALVVRCRPATGRGGRPLPLPELARRAAEPLGEHRGEVLAGGESAGKGDVGHRGIRLLAQQVGGIIDAAVGHLVDRRHVGDAAYMMYELRNSQAAGGGHLLQAPLQGECSAWARRSVRSVVPVKSDRIDVPIVNIELHENMEFACPSSISPSGAQRTSRVGRRRVGGRSNPEPHSIWRTSRYGTNSASCIAR